MLAFLRKSIEKGDVEITREERVLEKALTVSQARKEKEERENAEKKKGKGGKSNKKAASKTPKLAPSKSTASNVGSKTFDSLGNADSSDALYYSMSTASDAGSDGILLSVRTDSSEAGGLIVDPANPGVPVILPGQDSSGSGVPDILQMLQEKARSTLEQKHSALLVDELPEGKEPDGDESTEAVSSQFASETKEEDQSVTSKDQNSVGSNVSILAELPPVLVKRYFGYTGKQCFYNRYHWLAEQYRKLGMPGEDPDFIFQHLDDPLEEYFFSRGDADVEDKLGNPSLQLTAEFQTRFDRFREGLVDKYHSGSEKALSPPVSPVKKNNITNQQSGWDSWPSTPAGSMPPTPSTFQPPIKLPSLQSFSSVSEDATKEPNPEIPQSPWTDERHRSIAEKYKTHSKSSLRHSRSAIELSQSMPSLPQKNPRKAGKELTVKTGVILEPLQKINEPSPPTPVLWEKKNLNVKRSSILDLSQSLSFSLSASKSLKKQIEDDEFFQSNFSGDCNGIESPASPRSRYIMNCLRNGLNPKSSFVVRKTMTRSLDLQHQGIGDEMAGQIASSLQKLPCLQSLNLEDNNLTGEGLGPILQAAMLIEGLKELNLSRNEIDDIAAEELGNYLVRDDCTLERLILHHADVDDFEGERFVNALAGNTSLTEVDLSYNKIGSAEILNTVFPDLTTATEALADLLTQPTCPLKKLTLTWNMMRLDSAVQFAQALAVNESLTYLDVSYNAFGNDAGCALGDALLDNRTLRTLMISNNGIDSKACFTICIGVQENLGLKMCILDGNPIGEAGAKALMVLPSVVGTRVHVSANNCNTGIRDPTFWYDQNYPCAQYELHLNDPFERAVCYQLLGLVACHQTLIMINVYFESVVKGVKKVEKLDLVQETFREKCKYLDEEQLLILENLYTLQAAATNTDEAIALFQKYDADESGALDKHELKDVLHDFGLKVDDDKIDDFIQIYDVDGEGLIELPEFLSFVKSQQQEAGNRIRDMTENMGMALAATPHIRFAPAREGVLKFEVIDSFTKKAKYQVISSSDGANLTNVAKKTGDVAKLLSYGFQNSKIRLSEALDLFQTMTSEGGEKFKTIGKLLPQIETSDEARMFIARVTKNDRVEISRVKIAMGNALRPIIGLPNGYYMLDLSKDTDRICLSRLLEISNTRRFHNMNASKLGIGIVGDTSQKGNWSCFRNEMYHDSPVEISTKLFTPMPRSGKLHFDFSSTERPPDDAVILTDSKFLKILTNLAFIESPTEMQPLSRMATMKKEAKKTLGGTGLTIYETSLEQAMQLALDMTQFYDELINRDVFYMQAVKAEEIKISLNSENASPWGSRPVTGAGSPSRPQSSIAKSPDVISSSKMAKAESPKNYSRSASMTFTQEIHGAPDDTQRQPENSTLPKSLSLPLNLEEPPQSAPQTIARDAMRIALKELIVSTDISPEAKGARLVEAIEELLGAQYFRARHLAYLLEKFPSECLVDKVPMFSTYRVEIIPHELAFLYCRLGRFNLYNPMKPEGGYELNLSIYEERQLAKILVTLSVIEPGDNFIGAQFRWDRESPFIPGWEVTQPWTTEEGLSKKGFFSVMYYCGNGKNKNGCKAEVVWRKCLLQMVLIDESDVIDEDDEKKIPKSERPRVGEELMLGKAKERWLSYLSPNAEELKKFRDEQRRLKEEEDRKNGVVKRFRPSKK